MKKQNWKMLSLVVALFLLTACGKTAAEEMPQTESEETVKTEEMSVDKEMIHEEAEPETMDTYADILQVYEKAQQEKWTGDVLIEKELSLLALDSYGRLGSVQMDLDNDDSPELLIGAVDDPILYDLYTLENGKAVRVAMSQARDRWYLGVEEAGGWFLTNEGSSGAESSTWFYHTLDGTKLPMHQGILYQDGKWYMTYERSFDTEGAEAIEKDLGRGVVEAYEMHYTQPSYTFLGSSDNAAVDYSGDMTEWMYRPSAEDAVFRALCTIDSCSYGTAGASLAQQAAAEAVLSLSEQEDVGTGLRTYLEGMNATQLDYFSFQWQMIYPMAEKLPEADTERLEILNDLVHGILQELGVTDVWKSHTDLEPFWEWTE
ncbi:MAG: hypothetical protein IKU27_05230 [Clostridia bacterium]|nr:hypothetical protein [Clostridia bacterium]